MPIRALANRVVSTTTAVPHAVRQAARRATIDTIAVALAGRDEPASRAATAWARETSQVSVADFWGTPGRASIADAAFVNATCSHALDFDDTLPSVRAHASAVAAAAGLAVAQAESSTLGEYLDAFALGVEVIHRLGTALGHTHYDQGWHTTGTVGAFGAAAAAARLWKLDAETTCRAWGAVASLASGLSRNFGTDVKPMHAGFAARSGVFAAWLAREGVTASTEVWSGPRGFVDAFSGEGSEIDDGEGWALFTPGLSVKRWPCCFASHRAIAGLEALLAIEPVPATKVERIDVTFLPGSDRALVHERPQTGLEAKFSVEYPLAALVLNHRIDAASFTDAEVRRPAVQDLMARINRVHLPGDRLYSGSGVIGHTDVTLHAAGSSRTIRIDRVPGSRTWPLSDEEFAQKIVSCASQTIGGHEPARRWLSAATTLGVSQLAVEIMPSK